MNHDCETQSTRVEYQSQVKRVIEKLKQDLPTLFEKTSHTISIRRISVFNGYSTYKLNQDGLMYEHIDTWDRKPGEILQQFSPS